MPIFFLPYLLLAGDRESDKKDGAATADGEEVRGEEATTEELALVKDGDEGLRGKGR